MTRTPAPALTAVLDELDELRAKAVSTPWRAEEGRIYGVGYLLAKVVGDEPKHHAARDADAALIVAAVNRLPQLTAALRAVAELADNLDAYTTRRGRPAPGSHDDGVNKAQADAAEQIRAAITTALEASR